VYPICTHFLVWACDNVVSPATVMQPETSVSGFVPLFMPFLSRKDSCTCKQSHFYGVCIIVSEHVIARLD